MKRFWKNATVGKHESFYTVLLDNRPLKTPSGNTLLVPSQKSLVATLVAAEWENQEKLLKHHALPMVSTLRPDFFFSVKNSCYLFRPLWPRGHLTQW
jgi:ATP synthase F1 complex assembly factor 2